MKMLPCGIDTGSRAAACTPAAEQRHRAATHGGRFDFFSAGLAHIAHFDVQTKRHACQRVVAVKHHVGWVDLGDEIEHISRHVLRFAALGQTFKGHACFQLFGEQSAIFKTNHSRIPRTPRPRPSLRPSKQGEKPAVTLTRRDQRDREKQFFN